MNKKEKIYNQVSNIPYDQVWNYVEKLVWNRIVKVIRKNVGIIIQNKIYHKIPSHNMIWNEIRDQIYDNG